MTPSRRQWAGWLILFALMVVQQLYTAGVARIERAERMRFQGEVMGLLWAQQAGSPPR